MTQARLPFCEQNLRAASTLSDTLSPTVCGLFCDWPILSFCGKGGDVAVLSVVRLYENSADWPPSCHQRWYSSFLGRHQSLPRGSFGNAQCNVEPLRQTGNRTHRPV